MQPGSKNRRAADKEFQDLLLRNVEAISRLEQASQQTRTGGEVLADRIAGLCGTIQFVYIHCGVIAAWLAWNLLAVVPPELKFDRPPFNLLGSIVSVEAIFLATFILISQNRQQSIADRRNHLDLQINLLAEQENSQMLAMLRQIMERLDIREIDSAAEILQQSTDPELLAGHIEQAMDTGEGEEEKPGKS